MPIIQLTTSHNPYHYCDVAN